MEFSKLHLNVDNRAEVLVLTKKLKPFCSFTNANSTIV